MTLWVGEFVGWLDQYVAEIVGGPKGNEWC